MDPLALLAFGPAWLQPEYLIETYGLTAVLLVVFVECGLLLFFLPGDSLLFATGVFVGASVITENIGVVIVAISAGGDPRESLRLRPRLERSGRR